MRQEMNRARRLIEEGVHEPSRVPGFRPVDDYRHFAQQIVDAAIHELLTTGFKKSP